MKLNSLLIGSLMTMLVFISCDKEDDEDVNTQDNTFVMQASMSNRAEIEMGTLAGTKATNSSVKAFAQMMVTEHTTAKNDLMNVAANTNVKYADSLDAENVTLKQTLSGLSGVTFDRAYMQSQVTAHQKTLMAFDAELNSGSHSQIKSYASIYRPHIQMHLDSATAIYNRIK